MQTFLTTRNLVENARCLDWRRLGKQRVEAKQIIDALDGKNSGGWVNHPAVLMWDGCQALLEYYFNVIAAEWKRRGYQHNMGWMEPRGKPVEPKWMELHGEKLYSSHRAALLYKAPEHYTQFGWTETPALDYWWPTEHGF